MCCWLEPTTVYRGSPYSHRSREEQKEIDRQVLAWNVLAVPRYIETYLVICFIHFSRPSSIEPSYRNKIIEPFRSSLGGRFSVTSFFLHHTCITRYWCLTQADFWSVVIYITCIYIIPGTGRQQTAGTVFLAAVCDLPFIGRAFASCCSCCCSVYPAVDRISCRWISLAVNWSYSIKRERIASR